MALTKLKYIQSNDNSQYIDTGISIATAAATDEITIEAQIAHTDIDSGTRDFCFGFDNGSYSHFVEFNASGYFGTTNGYITTFTPIENKMYDVSMTICGGTLTRVSIDGHSIITNTAATQSTTWGNLRLFGITDALCGNNIRIGNVKIYYNDNLVRDMFPCTTGSIIGMYDNVTSSTYVNSGSSTFIVGPIVEVLEEINIAIQPVDYITFTNGQYINTDWVYTPGSAVKISATKSSTGAVPLFGNDVSDNQFSIGISNSSNQPYANLISSERPLNATSTAGKVYNLTLSADASSYKFITKGYGINSASRSNPDLSGTTWSMNDTLTGVIGSNTQAFSCNMTINGTTYTKIQSYTTSGKLHVNVYTTSGSIVEIYNIATGTGWVEEAYKTITFNYGSDCSNSTVINWFTNNGTMTSGSLNAGPTAQSTTCLLGTSRASDGSATACSINKNIYGCQIYEGTTLVKNFEPVYNLVTKTYGMYESVEDKLYENAGTGTLNAGSYINEVEYVENTDSAIFNTWNFDTGVFVKDTGKIVVDLDVISQSSDTKNKCLSCSLYATSTTASQVPDYFCYSNDDTGANITLTERKTDGTKVSWIYTYNLTDNKTIHVSAGIAGTDTGKFDYKRITIYDTTGTIILRDFVPARNGSVGGIYDLITGQFIYNQSSATTTYGADTDTSLPGDPGLYFEKVKILCRVWGAM